jgi:hypothetical protein
MVIYVRMESSGVIKEWIPLISTSKTPQYAIQGRNEKIKKEEEKREIPGF